MTRQLHAAVPTSETRGADCKHVRDLYHPLNSWGAQVRNHGFQHPIPALLARYLAIDFTDFRCVPIASLLHEFYIGHLE